jgi:hypothetical protein
MVRKIDDLEVENKMYLRRHISLVDELRKYKEPFELAAQKIRMTKEKNGDIIIYDDDGTLKIFSRNSVAYPIIEILLAEFGKWSTFRAICTRRIEAKKGNTAGRKKVKKDEHSN